MSFKVSIFSAIGFILLLKFQGSVFAKNQKLKFCAVYSKHTHNSIQNFCQSLVKLKNSKVECVVKFDRISCLKLLINDQVDFMTTEPEDLIVVGLNEVYNNKVLVTHELRVWEEEHSSFEMVVVVRKDIENIFLSEKKRLCLPGFDQNSVALDYVKRLETKFVASDCNPIKSLLENRLSALSEYFESACISGPWTSDHQFDTHLKRKYGNLCSSCGNGCSDEDKYYGEEGVLLCLTEGGGDVAWTKLDFFRQNFKKLDGEQKEYKFLCPDGESRKLTEDPCIWLEVPWRTIIARKNAAEKVSKFITNQNNQTGDFLMFLQHDIRITPVNVETFKTPNDYLKFSFPDYYSLKDHLQCKPDRRVKWCVTSDLEAQKCEWISKAANSYGVEPLIECIQETSRENCIKSVIDKKTDIFPIKPPEDLEARKKGLKPIIHMVTNKENQANEVAAVVAASSDLQFFNDLKNRKACFTGFRDAGWNSFVYAMGNLTGDNDWYCKDKEMVSKFFEESCVVHLDERNSTFPRNLYSLCSHTEFNNVDKIALNCLNSGHADVAFFNLNSVLQFYPNNFGMYYKTLCLNESISDPDEQKKCFLSWTTLGSIVVNENVSTVRKEDISLMLMNLNRLFGETYHGLTPLVSLYGSFEGDANFIFPEFTQSLKRDISHFRSSRSYHEILEDLMKYRESCNEANSLRQKVYFLILPLMYLLRMLF